MLAQGTDEVLRELLADVLIPADGTAPDGLALRGLADLLRLRLDVLVVVGIGGGRRVVQADRLGDLRDEERVRAKVDAVEDAPGEIGVRPLQHRQRAVGGAPDRREARQLVRLPPGGEAEAPEERKIRSLADDRDREGVLLHEQIVRVALLVDGDGDAVRRRRDLSDRVDDASVVLAVRMSGEDKQSVGELVHGVCCHRDTPRFP